MPLPLYRGMAVEYNQRSQSIHFEYVPLGTTEGMKQIGKGIGDFGAGKVERAQVL